jgi:hypothetical protein
MAKEGLMVGNHKWPGLIDLDSDGTLYFTDAVEKDLLRIKRTKAAKLRSGFSHASGIKIHKDRRQS